MGGGQTQIGLQERDLINLGYVTQAVYSLLFVTGIIMFSPNVTVLWVASKGKTVSSYAMQAPRGRGNIAPTQS
jgi:hypothetical protein